MFLIIKSRSLSSHVLVISILLCRRGYHTAEDCYCVVPYPLVVIVDIYRLPSILYAQCCKPQKSDVTMSQHYLDECSSRPRCCFGTAAALGCHGYGIRRRSLRVYIRRCDDVIDWALSAHQLFRGITLLSVISQTYAQPWKWFNIDHLFYICLIPVL